MSEVKTFDTQQKRSAAQRRRLFIILIAGLIIVLIGSSLAAYFTFFLGRGSPAAIPMVGHAFFVSSGLLSTSPESSQGITDQLQINLQGVPATPTYSPATVACSLLKRMQTYHLTLLLSIRRRGATTLRSPKLPTLWDRTHRNTACMIIFAIFWLKTPRSKQ